MHTELHGCWSTVTDVDWKIFPSFIMTLDWRSKMKWASEEETVDEHSKPIHAGGLRISDTLWHNLIMYFGAPIQQIQRKTVKSVPNNSVQLTIILHSEPEANWQSQDPLLAIRSISNATTYQIHSHFKNKYAVNKNSFFAVCTGICTGTLIHSSLTRYVPTTLP
jgi:hypothetical protein